MGFEYDPGEDRHYFTPGQFEILPAQGVQLIHEVEAGEVRYIPATSVWVGREDRRMWLDEFAPAYTSSEFCNLGDDDAEEVARLIRIPEGYIVDFSHLDQYEWRDVLVRWEREGGLTQEEIQEGRARAAGVVHCIHNKQELSLVQPILEEQYKIAVAGTEVERLLDAIGEVLDEEEGESYEEDDDDDELPEGEWEWEEVEEGEDDE